MPVGPSLNCQCHLLSRCIRLYFLLGHFHLESQKLERLDCFSHHFLHLQAKATSFQRKRNLQHCVEELLRPGRAILSLLSGEETAKTAKTMLLLVRCNLSKERPSAIPDLLEELVVLSDAFVQIDSNVDFGVSLVSDNEFHALGKETPVHTFSDLLDDPLLGHAVRNAYSASVGFGQQDLAKCCADVCTKFAEIMLLKRNDAIGKGLCDINTAHNKPLFDVRRVANVVPCLVE
mmetsp:Transcript_88310/g.152902  ORF Transcript_88310/g.152902 Transcript_88310/m.152902 type:complete len:233 (-) Transcript_88310:726-1424(-)